MMWMTILRPLVVLVGVISLAAAAVMAQIIPKPERRRRRADDRWSSC